MTEEGGARHDGNPSLSRSALVVCVVAILHAAKIHRSPPIDFLFQLVPTTHRGVCFSFLASDDEENSHIRQFFELVQRNHQAAFQSQYINQRKTPK
jgi:hypothetical protein